MYSCCLFACPFQLASLSGAASPTAPAALPCRWVPWARPGFGGAALTLRWPCRRKLRSAAESPGHRRLSFAAAAGQLSNSSRAQHEKLQVAVFASKATAQLENGLSLQSQHVVPEDVKAAGFQIGADVMS